jgi:hypothetical protein
VGGVLLVAYQYVPYTLTAFEQFIIDKQNRPAGIAEHGIHPLFDEGFN